MKTSRSIFSQLRWISLSSTTPRCAVQRNIGRKLGVRYASATGKASSTGKTSTIGKASLPKASPSKIHIGPKKSSKPGVVKPASHPTTPSQSWRPTPQRAAPENILIYHAGTGKIVFLGMVRTATIFVFGISSIIIAPAFFANEFPWYIAPLIIIGGALPLTFVAYTSAPFVNNIYLHLPVFARRSREAALEYVKSLPSTATLSIRTMKITTIPRATEVRVSDLVPDKAMLRPVSFRNQNPQPIPWWRLSTLKQFYATSTSKTARATPKFYPELWDPIFKKIQSQG